MVARVRFKHIIRITFFAFVAMTVPFIVYGDTIPLEVGIGSIMRVSTLEQYIAEAYTFIVLTIGILSAVEIMFAGYEYGISYANPEVINSAKDRAIGAITGLIIALASYTLLNSLNPALLTAEIEVKEIAFSTAASQDADCKPMETGPCSVANLEAVGFSGEYAVQASSICRIESGGNASLPSGVDICEPGGVDSVSWGLFQINLTYHNLTSPTTGVILDCQSAFDQRYNASNHNCTVVDRTKYENCIAAAKDPTTNATYALQLSGGGRHWGQWGANSKCGFPS